MKSSKKFALMATVFVFVAGMTFTSCDTCTTCSYTYEFLGADTTITSPEVCGNEATIQEYKDQTEAAATLVGGTVNCVDN